MTTAEEFFSERELRVDDGLDAKGFYDALQSELDNASIYGHTSFGAPEEGDPHKNPAWFFRGQSDSSWGLQSSLYRLLSNELQGGRPAPAEEALAEAEKKILETARENGLVRGLTALETLTVLQHHGAPTRLLDVTTDWRVGLYFACESSLGSDGRLFLVAMDSGAWQSFPQAKGGERDKELIWYQYKEAFDESTGKWLQSVWPVLLPFADPRMIAQRGFFLVGGIVSNQGDNPQYWGAKDGNRPKTLKVPELRDCSSLTIRFSNERHQLQDAVQETSEEDVRGRGEKWSALGYSVRVPQEHKRELLKILKNEGVSKDTMYPPLSESIRLLQHVAQPTPSATEAAKTDSDDG